MAPTSYNFSSYWQSTLLADLTINITWSSATDAPPSAKKRRFSSVGAESDQQGQHEQEQLPGHGIVLANASECFRQQIERWAQQGLGKQKKPNLVLQVEPDQALAARALLYYCYTGRLPPEELQIDEEQEGEDAGAAALDANAALAASRQVLLVHTLSLAQRFQVPDATAACLEALLAPPLPAFAWDTVHLVTRLPAATLAMPALAPLLERCRDKLHAELGDMEAVLNCDCLQRSMLALPFHALRLLLEDARTAAISENSVLVLANNWLAAQAPCSVCGEERLALAHAVRVPLLEPLFLATVVPKMAWFVEVLGTSGLALAAGLLRGASDPCAQPVLAGMVADVPPAWLAGQRPTPGQSQSGSIVSVVSEDEEEEQELEGALLIQWDVELSALREHYEASVRGARSAGGRQQGQCMHRQGSGGMVHGGPSSAVAASAPPSPAPECPGYGAAGRPAPRLRSATRAWAGYRWNLVLYFQHLRCDSDGDEQGGSACCTGGCTWTARLALEAAPAMAVRGQTLVAFSGSLSALVTAPAGPSGPSGRRGGASSSTASTTWMERELPEASWLKHGGRRCDHGYRDFFEQPLSSWDQRAWDKYAPEGRLHLRARIRNVR